jgi:hypothetical protein
VKMMVHQGCRVLMMANLMLGSFFSSSRNLCSLSPFLLYYIFF